MCVFVGIFWLLILKEFKGTSIVRASRNITQLGEATLHGKPGKRSRQRDHRLPGLPPGIRQGRNRKYALHTPYLMEKKGYPQYIEIFTQLLHCVKAAIK